MAKKPLNSGYQDESSSREPPPVQNTHKNIVASSDLLEAKTKEMKAKSSKNLLSMLTGGSSKKLTANSNVSAASNMFSSTGKRGESYLAQNSYDSKGSEEPEDDDAKIGYFSPPPNANKKDSHSHSLQTPSPNTGAGGSAPTSAGSTVVPHSGKKKMPPALDFNKIGVAPAHIKAPGGPGGSRPSSATAQAAKKYKPEEKLLQEENTSATGGKKLGRKAPAASKTKQSLKINDVSGSWNLRDAVEWGQYIIIYGLVAEQFCNIVLS